jgi:hypothetical protein
VQRALVNIDHNLKSDGVAEAQRALVNIDQPLKSGGVAEVQRAPSIKKF